MYPVLEVKLHVFLMLPLRPREELVVPGGLDMGHSWCRGHCTVNF